MPGTIMVESREEAVLKYRSWLRDQRRQQIVMYARIQQLARHVAQGLTPSLRAEHAPARCPCEHLRKAVLFSAARAVQQA